MEIIKLREEFQTTQANLDIARKDTSDLIDESTFELENNIKNQFVDTHIKLPLYSKKTSKLYCLDAFVSSNFLIFFSPNN